MFAEELTINSAKQRQEAAKARRRLLLQKKQHKQKQSAQSVNKNHIEVSSQPVNVILATVAKPIAISASTSVNTNVQKTIEQRQIRKNKQLLNVAVVKVQSTCRRGLSFRETVKAQSNIYDKRITDVMTLRTILAQTNNNVQYTPPPATAAIMTTQFLFLFDRVSKINHQMVVNLWTQLNDLLRYILMPGLTSSNDDMNPILPWLDDRFGQHRILRLYLACTEFFLYRARTLRDGGIVEQAENNVVGQFLRTTLRDGGRLGAYCKALCRFGECSRHKEAEYLHQKINLLQKLRLCLLETGGGAMPLNADEIGNKCVCPTAKENVGDFFLVVLEAVLQTKTTSHKLKAEFFSVVMTVPLLSWKLSNAAIVQIVNSKNGSLVPLMTSYSIHYKNNLKQQDIESCLPRVDLLKIPIPSCTSLLANMVQLGAICPTLDPVSGRNQGIFDASCAANFYNLLASLLHVIPVGTFTSRSAVAWVTDGGQSHVPIIISPVVIDMCKGILTDAYVRAAFQAAIDDDILRTDATLHHKSEEDLKYEKDLTEAKSSSAASLAAAEARKGKNFWQKSSKWAKKLSTTMSSLLSADTKNAPAMTEIKGGGELVNTSTVSRRLATGKRINARPNVTKPSPASKNDHFEGDKKRRSLYSTELLYSLCRAYGVVLARWGGGGRYDIVRGKVASINPTNSEHHSSVASNQAEVCALSLLNVLCFSTNIVRTLWALIQSDVLLQIEIKSLTDPSTRPNSSSFVPIHALQIGCFDDRGFGAILLFMFASCLVHVLVVTDDGEIHDFDKPIPRHQLRRCIVLFRKLLFRACCIDIGAKRDYNSRKFVGSYFGLSLIAVVAKGMRDLYDRSSRRPLCLPKLWIVEDLLEREINSSKTHAQLITLLSTPILNVMPALVPFKRRLKLFEKIVSTNRLSIQGSHATNDLEPGIGVKIMRGRVLEDGIHQLNNLGPRMRERIRVIYVNEAGVVEGGIDVGGLFKEFWTDLSNLAFQPGYALFCATEGSANCLYPNPSSRAAHGSDDIMLFEFLGRILGKALYEGITIQPLFAHFFLSFLKGDYNYLHMLSDLSTIDPQLYTNLMFLKTYEGDAADLCLAFTVANNDFGTAVEVPLIPGGEDIEVTNYNKHRYIGRVAKHHVCDRVREQSEAFTRGLWEVIDKSWLKLFNEPELRVLISGATEGKIDVDDLQAHTKYAGGYTGFDRTVTRFWSVMRGMKSEHQAGVLRFVTSCERSPPLGFSSMHPPFTIQRVGILRDGDKLPSSSTCFNVLKLPTYSSEKMLRERLIYAIESGTGFELS